MTPRSHVEIIQASKGSKTVLVSWASILLACSTYSGSARADNVPSTLTLKKDSSQKICLIGYSVAKGPLASYYLQGGAWTAVPSSGVDNLHPLKVTSTEITATGSMINTVPASSTLLNAANLTFFYAPDCSKISYSLISSVGDVIKADYQVISTNPVKTSLKIYPYNTALLEYTVDMDANGRKLIIDYSNVDNLQGFLEIAITGTPGTVKLGNQVPVSSAVANFRSWLILQLLGLANARQFLPLASGGVNGSFEPSPGPFNSIQSPTQYLEAKCATATDDKNYPYVNGKQCTPGEFVHLRDPLNSYYEDAVSTFFSNVATTNLKLMGDAQGPYKQAAWQVSNNTTRCPIFLQAGNLSSGTDASLTLQYKGTLDPATSPAKTDMFICNPANQVQFLNPDFTPSVAQNGTTATITLSQAQFQQVTNTPKKGIGYNIGQPETNWIGNIYATDPASHSVSVNVQTRGTTPFLQMNCQAGCITANPGLGSSWFLSNVPFGSDLVPYETASKMVFANDGVFSTYGDYFKYPVGSPAGGTSATELGVVYQSIVRNIAQAFSRGIEKCTPSTLPNANCLLASALPAKGYNGADVSTTASAIWTLQSNWYPALNTKNYYTEYLHTGTLNSIPGGKNILFLPNGKLSADNGIAISRQLRPMAMAYGFAFDENAIYLNNNPAPSPPPGGSYTAQVPTKLDPIPAEWGQVSVVVTAGPLQ
jgi:hypothetical protein